MDNFDFSKLDELNFSSLNNIDFNFDETELDKLIEEFEKISLPSLDELNIPDFDIPEIYILNFDIPDFYILDFDVPEIDIPDFDDLL
ncbi:hypothetical protein [Ruminococcus sp.]|uniref:hypothetical protein n=1 Tax=Ruminococcus sp. TaxID=41978 RepID=UPI0025EFF7C0|nr:hypothetical protein [Ruminococcus sp.]MBQ9541948.1 hypothetical protein [Ruminococcus sp.]